MMQIPTWIRIAAVSASGLVANAQTAPDVSTLSATSNGLAVYGATNLTLRGESADGVRKLVKWDNGSWVTALRNWGSSGDGHEYQRIQEDASGRFQIYTATFGCGTSTGICISREAGIVYGSNRESGVTRELGYGVGSVSDNGEWAIAATDVPTPELRGPEIRRVRLMDGRMETVVEYSQLTNHPVRRIIADNGLIAITSSGLLLVWRPGTLQPEKSKVPFESFVIDPAGQFVLGVGGGFRMEGNVALYDTLYRVDLDTKALTTVAQTQMGIQQPDLASDGHTLVFVSAADWEGKNPKSVKQVWLADLRSDSKTQLTNETENVKEVVLSGYGSVAYAVTENLRLLRIDLATRQTQEIAPEYPQVLAADPVTSRWALGGRYWLWGRGFGDAEIFAGDKPASVTTQSGDDVEFLVPLDAPLGKNLARVGAKGSPFQATEIGVEISTVSPAFLGSGGRGVTWLHSDGATPITVENPARLGETVTAQMTGMGPVDQAGNTTTGFQWSLVESYPGGLGGRILVKTPIPVIGSRVSGEAGVYLVTIHLPDALHSGGGSRYEGIEVALSGGTLPAFSSLPLQIQ